MEEESGDAGTHVGKDLRWCKSEKSINRLVALVVKNLPANAGDTGDAGSLGWEDPLKEGAATYSSILAWRIPWTEDPDRLQSIGSQRVGHD